MSNPYLDDNEDPTPTPRPAARPFPWVALALLLGVLGCFLPTQQVGCTPFPIPPGPGPTPTPVDPVTTKDAWVVVVEETSERTPFTTAVLTAQLWRELEGRGLKWRIYDDDATEAAVYAKIVNELGVPVLIILDADGKLLSKQPLPGTVDELDAAIKKATGR